MQDTVIKALIFLMVLGSGSCQHDRNMPKPDALPSWIQRPAGVKWDAKANAVAQLACRNQKSSLSAQEKVTLQLFEAHYRILRFSPTADTKHGMPPIWNQMLAKESQALKATHLGAFEGAIKNNECVSLVLLRRHVNNLTYLPQQLSTQSVTPIHLKVEHSIEDPQLFIQHPNGHIHRENLVVKKGRLTLNLSGSQWPKGHYIVEVLGQAAQGNPEILFWWRLTQTERTPHPWPRLRFEELSQTDKARSMKVENMIVQLRGTAQVHRLHVSPQLKTVAKVRAKALSEVHGIGHNRPHAQTPDQSLKAHFPHPEVAQIAEIQAQSTTLKEAWDGIVESPAHIYPLISKGVSHMGASAILSKDAVGQPLVTLVVLLGSDEKSQLSHEQNRVEMLGEWNQWRHDNSLPLLAHDGQLQQEAQLVAQQMAAEGPVQTWSIERDLMPGLLEKYEDLTQITGTLLYGSPPTVLDKAPWLKNKEWSVVGIGLVPDPSSDLWFVCILVGQRT